MSEILKELEERAHDITFDTLNKFINELQNNSFDTNEELTGLIALAGVAATQAMRTHFNQVGTRAQDMRIAMIYLHGILKLDCPIKITLFDEMLFPNNDLRFEKIIPPTVFQYLQNRANFILNDEELSTKCPPEVIEHLESIIRGHVPYGFQISS